MVAVDQLNYDVLGLIFAFLNDYDLVAVCLVNRSFSQGVIPLLYHSIYFRHSHAKRYSLQNLNSPFATILRHPERAAYVHTCELTALPQYKGRPFVNFVSDCVRALELCKNITGFFCTPKTTPSFLSLSPQWSRLGDLRIQGSLTNEQAALLMGIGRLRSLALDGASSSLLSILPQWAATLSPTLRLLSISMTTDLSSVILEGVLKHLPRLLSLRIISCYNILHTTLFKALHHLPELQQLAFTAWDTQGVTLARGKTLSSLRDVAIETRIATRQRSPHALWTSLIALTARSSPLESLSLDIAERTVIDDSLITDILNAHAGTLKELWLDNCSVATPSLAQITTKCKKLHTLALQFPGHLEAFTTALSHSRSLKTLIDAHSAHSHTHAAPIRSHSVCDLQKRCPTITKVVCDGRQWDFNRSTLPDDGSDVAPAKHKTTSARAYLDFFERATEM